MNRLLDFIVGREPVAGAVGLAGVVTAGLGVAAAFGLAITAEQIAAVGVLAAAIAGWAARRAVTPTAKLSHLPDTLIEEDADRGSLPLGLILFVIVVVLIIGGIAVSCDAMFEDEDEVDDLGQVELVSHDYDDRGDYSGDQDYDQYNNDDRNRNRNRNRGAFSPGPFDDSPVDAFNGNTICLPGSTCYADDRREEDRSGERP